MKKFVRLLSLVLVLLLAFTGAAVAETEAEQVNMFRNYSTNELFVLKAMLETEIASRENKDKEVTVPAGIYTVGLDIPVGTYTITSPGYADITIKNKRGFSVLSTWLNRDESIGKIELKDGYTITIEGNPVLFVPYKGLGF